MPRDVPEELAAACARAMARDPADRFAGAAAFADELQAWLDGSRQRERALEVVARAEAAGPEAEALRAAAVELRREAEADLARVPSWAPEETKLASWAKLDEAQALEVRAALKLLERDQLLAGALTHAPGLPEAHAALAEDQRRRHAEVEEARDSAAVAREAALLRAHVEALPVSHPVRQRGAAYLRGIGAVTLVTEPEGAEVELLRYEPFGRRLVARPIASLGRAPIVEVPLEMGSYLLRLRLRRPGHVEVRYPVHIRREAHWDGVRPGARGPEPIHLPREGSLGADDCYVPAGWFQAGSARHATAVPPGPRWCEAFVMRRFPVTNREYLAFLDDLVATGREDEALRHAPRERGGFEAGAMVYGRDRAGGFELRPDADGDIWLPDWPVIQVDQAGAAAYAAWLAARTGQPWRLPWDLEWEKAARGVDGRFRPWGYGFDPSFCGMRDSHPGRPLPSVVDSWPIDESVYGVRGLGGNVLDWCFDGWSDAGGAAPGEVVAPVPPAPGGRSVTRGGYWDGNDGYIQCAYRHELASVYRGASAGFRVVRPLRG